MSPVPVRLRIRRIVATTIIAGAVLSAQPTLALTVYDPWNHAENILSAARALEQIENQMLLILDLQIAASLPIVQ